MRALTEEEVELISSASWWGGDDDDDDDDDDDSGTSSTSSTSTTTGSTITVTGSPSTSTTTSTTTTMTDGPGDGGEGGDSPGYDGPPIIVFVTDEANRAAVTAAATKLKAALEAINEEIQNLSDTDTVTLKDGSTVTGAELKGLWEQATFTVSDRTSILSDSAGGAVTGMNSEMHFSTVDGWSAADPNGLKFIALHEIAHMSPEGQAYGQQQWNEHRAADGDLTNTAEDQATYNKDSIDFVQNEQYANHAARELARMLDIPDMATNPTHGY